MCVRVICHKSNTYSEHKQANRQKGRYLTVTDHKRTHHSNNIPSVDLGGMVKIPLKEYKKLCKIRNDYWMWEKIRPNVRWCVHSLIQEIRRLKDENDKLKQQIITKDQASYDLQLAKHQTRIGELNAQIQIQQIIEGGKYHAEIQKQIGLNYRDDGKTIRTQIIQDGMNYRDDGKTTRDANKQAEITKRDKAKAITKIMELELEKTREENKMKQFILTHEAKAQKSKNNAPVMLSSLLDNDKHPHSYIMGSTTSGKSYLLKAIIRYHIGKNKDAVVVIDPHGELVEQLKHSISYNNLVYISSERSTTINPFDIPLSISNNNSAFDIYSEILKDSICDLIGIRSTGTKLIATTRKIVIYLLEHEKGSFTLFADILSAKHEADSLNLDDDIRMELHYKLSAIMSSRSFSHLFSHAPTNNIFSSLQESKVILFNTYGIEPSAPLGRMMQGIVLAYSMSHKAGSMDNKIRLFSDESTDYLKHEAERIILEGRKFGLCYTFIVHNKGHIPPKIYDSLENQQIFYDCKVINGAHVTTQKVGSADAVEFAIDAELTKASGKEDREDLI